jgi:PAS domain S-box-containing protein
LFRFSVVADRSAPVRYGVALAAVLVAALLRVAFEPLWGDRLPFFTFYPAVMLAGWCGGFRAGILATLVSALAHLVWPAEGHPWPPDAGETAVVALFTALGFGISAVTESLHRSRRRLEAAGAESRRLSQERLALLDSTGQGIFGVDLDGGCTFINLACAEMLGRPPGDVLGRAMHDLLHPRRADGRPYPRAECPLAAAMHAGQAAVLVDEDVWRRDGSCFPAEYSLWPVTVDGRIIGSVVSLTDLTERRRIEAEIRRLAAEQEAARAEAEQANRAKDDFLAVLSHELRTPLTAMLGWIGMLRSGRLPADRARYALEVIDRNTRMQAQLINDLLDVSRIVAGKMAVDRTPVDLAAVVVRAAGSAQREAEAKGIDLVSSITPSAGPVMGDVTRLEQIVTNLLGNALKFTPAEGRVDVRLDVHDGGARLRVSDTGPGIAADVLPHVFDRFRQAEGSSRRRHEGLGLGLAIVRHLVEAHGGAVRAESAGEGLGATFTVELPIVTAVAAPGRAATGAGPALLPAGETLRGLAVLVVEDHPDSREMIAVALRAAGADVMATPAVADALAVLRARRVDVLVSDLGMPGADGYDLLRRVRTIEARTVAPRLPAIALTAYASAEDRERTLAAGYDAHVAKPVDPGTLCAAVARVAVRSRV